MKYMSVNKQNSLPIYKSPLLRFIVFLFLVFIPFQIFLVYFIQRLSIRLNLSGIKSVPKTPKTKDNPIELKPTVIKPTQHKPVTTQPKAQKIAVVTQPTAQKKPPVVSSSSTDDLQLISGIGPKTREALNKSGITTFKQLAELNTEQITFMLELSGIRIKAVQSWIDQARHMS